MNQWHKPMVTSNPLFISIPNGQQLVAIQMGDITGDGRLDIIYLTASKTEDSAFLKAITLFVKYGGTNITESFQLEENAGFQPTIWLGDFTGDKVQDILITIDSGGSGAIIFAYIFSSHFGKMQEVFNSIPFDKEHPYAVNYADQYQVTVTSMDPKRKYTLDLHWKEQEYLNEIYNVDGSLKKSIEGWVDPISGLYPIDLRRNGKYDLLAVQQIAGRYHADSLGYVENLIQWNGSTFEIIRQNVAIHGEDL